MNFSKLVVILAALIAAELMCSDVNAIKVAPICIDDGKSTDCPPEDNRPAEVSNAGARRFQKKMKALIQDAIVIDMRNAWFRLMYKPEWVTFNSINGEQNYCKVRLQNYGGYAMFSEDSDWYYYLSIDEATCNDQSKLLKEAEDHIAFRSYRKILCDSGYVHQCMGAVWRWSEFIKRIIAEPIDDKKLEIVTYPDPASIRKRLAENYRVYPNSTPPPIHVTEYQQLQGTSCSRFELIGIICLTSDGVPYKKQDEISVMRVFPDERLFQQDMD